MIDLKKSVALSVMLLSAAFLGASELVSVNDLAPYDNARSDSFWKTTAHPYVTTVVTTSDASFDPASLFLGSHQSLALETTLTSEGTGFLEILSTISPGFMLMLR